MPPLRLPRLPRRTSLQRSARAQHGRNTSIATGHESAAQADTKAACAVRVIFSRAHAGCLKPAQMPRPLTLHYGHESLHTNTNNITNDIIHDITHRHKRPTLERDFSAGKRAVHSHVALVDAGASHPASPPRTFRLLRHRRSVGAHPREIDGAAAKLAAKSLTPRTSHMWDVSQKNHP